jgi:hypothetical protein
MIFVNADDGDKRPGSRTARVTCLLVHLRKDRLSFSFVLLRSFLPKFFYVDGRTEE